MVGFLQSPAADEPIKEENEDIKPIVSADTRKLEDLCNPELEDVPSSFSDLFLDLDSIDGWFLGGSPQLCSDTGLAGLGGNPIGVGSCIGDLGSAEDFLKASGNVILEKTEGQEKRVEKDREDISGGDRPGGKLGSLGCSIEEQLGKVSLGESNFMNGGEIAEHENVVKGEEATSDEDESCSDGGVKSEGGVQHSSSSSSASSSDSDSSSGSSDNEDGGEKDQDLEIEEGEIVLPDEVDEMVAWSDNEDVMVGPIMSKNELKDLPSVPPVNVTLQPHHETLPVGMILSIIGAQVIVEGVKKHNPLNEGSILWITESRLPLGIVDEIFGPVKNPYYIVRYNSEGEVPLASYVGTLVSFVQEFANPVLNDNSLYQKGYDASGENDEELSDELEFSDDEKEAEYRRMLKMKKRGMDGPKPANRRKEKQKPKQQYGNWNHNRGEPRPQTPLSGNMIPATQDQQSVMPLPIAAPLHQENISLPLGPNGDLVGNQAMASPFQSKGPAFGRPTGICNNNGFPHQQQQQKQTPLSGNMIPAPQEQQSVGPPPIAAPLNQENISFPLGPNGELVGNQPMASPFQSKGPAFGRPTGIWNNNGFPHQQQQQNQSMVGPQPSGLPGNGGILWMQQNGPFQFFEMPPQTNMTFHQQMGPIPGLPFNFNGLGGQTNFVRGPMLAPPRWPNVSMGQNMLNPSQFGMGLQAQQASGTVNGGEKGGQLQGPQNCQNTHQTTDSLNFGRGRGGGGRRKGHYRGGPGRFGGGRGRFESHQNE